MADWAKVGSRGHVEDRRGMASSLGGISVTGLALLFLANYLMGGDVGDVLNQIQSVPQQNQIVESQEFSGEDEYEVFASTVLGSNDDFWKKSFNKLGKDYSPPKLVLFRSATPSSCGNASSDIGPHYCPLDTTIYLDETFFAELTSRLGAKGGDVAEAYVISHEVGHHVQNELNLLGGNRTNEDSIQTELQADCFAGLWAGSIKDKGILHPGEIGEAMDAAAAVGDDRIQDSVIGYSNPESWTHGSSTQRVAWFNKGYNSTEVSDCDTSKQ